MDKTKLKNFHWLWLGLFAIIVDQWTKYLAITHLIPFQSIELSPFFNLTLLFNTGAAFSLLDQAGGWQQWLFIVITFVVSGVIIVWLYRLPKNRIWSALALSLIFGGAIGNLIDRIRLGYVIDFLDFHIGEYHWYVFNLADSFITVAAIILIIDILRHPS
jgi:signal peptidase II